MASLLREGGAENRNWLRSRLGPRSLTTESTTDTTAAGSSGRWWICVIASPDPDPFDWRLNPALVWAFFCRAHRPSADVQWCEALLSSLRHRGLAPQALWVSSLRVLRFGKLCSGSIDSSRWRWSRPHRSPGSVFRSWLRRATLGSTESSVLQMLSSGRPRDRWLNSFQGLDPVDLSLQVVLPELDGRVTTRIGAFREVDHADPNLCTAVKRLEPDLDGLAWIADHVRAWSELRSTPVQERRLGLCWPTTRSVTDALPMASVWTPGELSEHPALAQGRRFDLMQRRCQRTPTRSWRFFSPAGPMTQKVITDLRSPICH